MTLPTIIVVCGPTATGKSDKAVALALERNGEVISADSRQVYTGLDIGSGKITKEEMRGVPHHMLDIVSPQVVYSVAEFQRQADAHIQDILSRHKIPIICGGTGFYIEAVVSGTSFPQVKANQELRIKLEQHTTEELFSILQTKDQRRAEIIDRHNRVRIIRALEIIDALGTVPETKRDKKYHVEWIYLDFPDEVLKTRIHDRLLRRVREGMIEEAEKLHTAGLSFARMESLGLEYKYLALLLQHKITKEDFMTQLERAIWQYAKRQRTWFKKYIPH